jgi:beta-glucosidase-like glycosyl hydrolase
VLSDDLGMHAAKVAGGVRARAGACLDAGCDLVLVCHTAEVEQLFDGDPAGFGGADEAIERLYGRPTVDRQELVEVVREGIREWSYWRASLEQLGESWS